MALLILSVVGSDRPGLTQAIASAVLSAGGWAASMSARCWSRPAMSTPCAPPSAR
jgi:glycine cleavage system regulatory protein